MPAPADHRPCHPRHWIRIARRPRRAAPGVRGVVVLAVVALLAACSAPSGDSVDPSARESSGKSSYKTEQPGVTSSSAQQILSEFGYAATNAVELIDKLDATAIADRPVGLKASVRPNELQLTGPAGNKGSLPLPDDRFYVSVAPYVSGTHECHFHSLTTCRGELSGATFDVTVRNNATGELLAEGPRTAFDNGFVGIWLPRGISATVSIAYQGKHAVAAVDTSSDTAATCVTTMQLT